ncbi:MAG TPA: formate dehydrogenase subunit delta [Methylococcus sp.]|nr:formate dehydrogenase subunit delta [Methylococcus sp.]
MHIETLVKMANDIGSFFQAEPDHAEAVQGVFEHLRKFWDPRMRKQIVAHYHAGGLGLSSLAREAVRKLADEMESIVQSGDG